MKTVRRRGAQMKRAAPLAESARENNISEVKASMPEPTPQQLRSYLSFLRRQFRNHLEEAAKVAGQIEEIRRYREAKKRGRK